jgi:hypothetical protein
MVYRTREGLGPQIDMRPDGSFAVPPGPGARGGLRRGLPWPVRIGIIAGLVALVAAGIAGAAIALWLVLMLIPVIAVAAIIAWASFRIQLWRARRGSVRGGRNLFRP